MGRRIHVLTTGGTIASTFSDGAATPTKRGATLVDTVPGLESYDLTVEEVTKRGSIEMDREVIADIGRRAMDASADVDGIVVTHGTDTMEESAYFLDLSLSLDVPVVFTGAQRGFDAVSPDGPANVQLAARAAAHNRLDGRDGVYVAFSDEVHAARYVTKTHTSSLTTFASPDYGPVATATHEGLRFHREPGSQSVTLSTLESDARVAMVKSGIEVDENQLEAAIEAGADGIVVEGTGVGNVAPGLARGIRSALDNGIPVVITTRCFTGTVMAKYGGESGGKSLRDAGAILGGDLPSHKARIKLILALESIDGTADLRQIFAHE